MTAVKITHPEDITWEDHNMLDIVVNSHELAVYLNDLNRPGKPGDSDTIDGRETFILQIPCQSSDTQCPRHYGEDCSGFASYAAYVLHMNWPKEDKPGNVYLILPGVKNASNVKL